MKKLVLIAALLLLLPTSTLAQFITSGVIADYQYIDSTGTTLPDHSSGGIGNGTLQGGPTVGPQGITFDGSISQYVLIPNITLTNGLTIEFVVNTSAAGLSPLLINSDGSYFLADAWTEGYSPTASVNGVIDSPQTNPSYDGSWHQVVLVIDPGGTNNASTLYWDGVVIGGGIPATSIRTPVILSALQIGAYGTAAALKGIIAHTKILDTTITQSQVRTELAAEQRLLASRRITLAQRPKLLLFDGDSISTGYVNIPTQDIFLSVVTSAMGRYGYSEINAAAGGQTAAQRAAAAPTNIAPIFSSPYGPIKKDYCVGEMGTNDLNAGDTAATTETNIAHWASLMTGLGCPVIYVTILPQCGKPASFETNRQLVNAWAARASVGKNATFRAIADVGNDPKMGRAGQCSNTTYYQDGTHPTATGHEVIAGYVENAIQDVDSLILGR